MKRKLNLLRLLFRSASTNSLAESRLRGKEGATLQDAPAAGAWDGGC
ncbi:hypothetical protein [Tychonema sp. LEGE 06208]|nr:hypothetical protein [Tychonema sp. LEGE 06208]MBE9162197.1 hypothetical protein [Tychonema sp. LEGE 06208]